MTTQAKQLAGERRDLIVAERERDEAKRAGEMLAQVVQTLVDYGSAPMAQARAALAQWEQAKSPDCPATDEWAERREAFSNEGEDRPEAH